jgi:hypothetical protein
VRRMVRHHHRGPVEGLLQRVQQPRSLHEVHAPRVRRAQTPPAGARLGPHANPAAQPSCAAACASKQRRRHSIPTARHRPSGGLAQRERSPTGDRTTQGRSRTSIWHGARLQRAPPRRVRHNARQPRQSAPVGATPKLSRSAPSSSAAWASRGHGR